ncbi:hypothetical protein ABH940_005582 [Streptacidiphilus sp. BW17]|uniref:hypothetical protein n=1 Tax=Streptacidiphilus sp. BW17 TaxID=3156274 RepID=UPI003514C69D
MLADRGFVPIPGTHDFAFTGTPDGSAYLHMRQTVAGLRGLGLTVDADPAFDYTAPPSPIAAAAGQHPLVVTGRPAPKHDVAVGRHHELGVIATNPRHDPDVAAQLLNAGFEPVTDDLLALSEPERDTVARASEAVASLRSAGWHVVSDLLFEPKPENAAQYTSTNPYAVALTEALDRGRAAPDTQDAAPVPAESAAPASKSPSARGNSSGDEKLLAGLAARSTTLTALKRLLDAVTAQLQGDPARIDFPQLTAALNQASTALDGVSRDLTSISAQVAPRTRTARTPGPRARAALATSTLLQGVTRQAITEERAAVTPTDPRLAYAAHR